MKTIQALTVMALVSLFAAGAVNAQGMGGMDSSSAHHGGMMMGMQNMMPMHEMMRHMNMMMGRLDKMHHMMRNGMMGSMGMGQMGSMMTQMHGLAENMHSMMGTLQNMMSDKKLMNNPALDNHMTEIHTQMQSMMKHFDGMMKELESTQKSEKKK